MVPLTLLSHGWGQAAGQAHGPCQVDLDVLLPLVWVTWRRSQNLFIIIIIIIIIIVIKIIIICSIQQLQHIVMT